MVTQLENKVRDEILSDIGAIEKDEKLYQEMNFNVRSQAIDYIEVHVIDRIDTLMERMDAFDEMNFLKRYAKKVIRSLEDVNTRTFCRLRRKISYGGRGKKLLMNLIDDYLDYNVDIALRQDAIGYDNLDMFLNGVLTNQKMPVETRAREPEMIYYQKTPARIILELIKKAEFKPHDVFFDLGSGLGQVTILVNLLTSVISKGVEFEPAFCSYAKACVADLNLHQVDFINIDARYADYSSGTVFFMYTPFEGKMLREVLENLKGEAKKRQIKIFTYGSCACAAAQQNWLINRCSCPGGPSEFFST